MMKIIGASNEIGKPMTEEETKEFLANEKNNLVIRIGLIDEKQESLVTPLVYYFDDENGKIYITTSKTSKKVQILRKNNVIGFCIDDTNIPTKGVRGKGTVKILVDINQSLKILKRSMLKVFGTLDNPIVKWNIQRMEKGDYVILEITPRYYSTWKFTMDDILKQITD